MSDAVRAWEANLYRASAVMLGCACERLVMELAKLAANNVAHRSAEKLRQKLGGKFAPHVADVFENLRELLDVAGLPPKLADGLDRKLVSIFEHARGLRNKSGHPTGEEVSQEEAHAGLLLFPVFCVFVDEVSAHLDASGLTPT